MSKVRLLRGRDVPVASKEEEDTLVLTRRGRRVHESGRECRVHGFAIAFVLFLAGAFSAFAPIEARAEASTDTLLLWMVYDNYDQPQIPDTSPTDLKYIDELRSRPDGKLVNGARLRVDGTDTYLNYFLNGEDTPKAVLPIATDPQEGVFLQAGPVWSDLSPYARPEYSFLVELGHWENGEWLVMAVSMATSYDDLVAGGWTTDGVRDYPRVGPWMPTYAVPEPTGGLLTLIGGALLALRRGNRERSNI